jgi:hypothetical protein
MIEFLDVEWLFSGNASDCAVEISLDDPVWVAFGGVAAKEPQQSLLPDLPTETR